jgi:adenylate cyclase
VIPSPLTVRDLRRCFEGAVPAVIATAGADGTPNVTYLSRVFMVDDERVALSNQFFSKTSRNLAENPRASVLLIDPLSYDQWRLTLVYERTERRGDLFERLRNDIDALAAIQHMQGVFKLRAADIYRVLEIEPVPGSLTRATGDTGASSSVMAGPDAAARLAELVTRLSRAPDLDTLVGCAVDGLATVLGYEHAALLLADEDGQRLYTIASHGFSAEGVGSEVVIGAGIAGLAAERAIPMRVGNLRQMTKYSSAIRYSYESDASPGWEIPLPALPEAQSSIAVPAMTLGELVGVLVVESLEPVAFSDDDVDALTLIASVIASGVELTRARALAAPAALEVTTSAPGALAGTATHVRHFEVDGSTFLDGDYLIKGVAGRILWSLLTAFERDGRTQFTNREVRLDPSLELPELRDNFESRLILLKRRLDERAAPIHIDKTGRGRFQLVIDGPLHLDPVPTA